MTAVSCITVNTDLPRNLVLKIGNMAGMLLGMLLLPPMVQNGQAKPKTYQVSAGDLKDEAKSIQKDVTRGRVKAGVCF